MCYETTLMRRLLLTLAILLLLSVLRPVAARETGSAFAPGVHLRFEQLTLDDGLSQNAGLALLQDRQGYLWIGTEDGLNRYNGYTLTHFKHDPDNPASLSHKSIIALYEDRDGLLWIGTWGGGLNRFDPVTGHFSRYLPDPANPASLSHPITLGEQIQGRLAMISRSGSQPDTARGYVRRRETITFYQAIQLVDYTPAAIAHFEALRRQGIRIGTQDLRIDRGAAMTAKTMRDTPLEPHNVVWHFKSVLRKAGCRRACASTTCAAQPLPTGLPPAATPRPCRPPQAMRASRRP